MNRETKTTCYNISTFFTKLGHDIGGRYIGDWIEITLDPRDRERQDRGYQALRACIENVRDASGKPNSEIPQILTALNMAKDDPHGEIAGILQKVKTKLHWPLERNTVLNLRQPR